MFRRAARIARRRGEMAKNRGGVTDAHDRITFVLSDARTPIARTEFLVRIAGHAGGGGRECRRRVSNAEQASVLLYGLRYAIQKSKVAPNRPTAGRPGKHGNSGSRARPGSTPTDDPDSKPSRGAAGEGSRAARRAGRCALPRPRRGRWSSGPARGRWKTVPGGGGPGPKEPRFYSALERATAPAGAGGPCSDGPRPSVWLGGASLVRPREQRLSALICGPRASWRLRREPKSGKPRGRVVERIGRTRRRLRNAASGTSSEPRRGRCAGRPTGSCRRWRAGGIR